MVGSLLLAGDPETQLAFALAGGKGAFAVLIGSGLSRAAEIPTGWEITIDLVRRVASAQGIEDESDWAEWFRSKTGEPPNYSQLVAELAKTQAERRALLENYIEPMAEGADHASHRQPTKAHRAIAQLVADGLVRVIVTTNFDRLLESALREIGIEPTVVASVDGLQGAEPLAHARCFLLKLHGDYKDARILNTDEELASYPPAIDALLDRIFDEYGLIVSGWSGEWDHALRAAFLRAPGRRYPTYWSARGALGDGAKQIVAHRDATVIQVADADGFFQRLSSKVTTLVTSRRQHPSSVALLASTAKRLLPKVEARIELEELVSGEVERAIRSVSDLRSEGGWDPIEFRRRIQLYESATEGLAKLAGIIGRWGDEKNAPLVLDVLRNLHVEADRLRSGLVAYAELRRYMVALVFTAYAMGLVRAENWHQLALLFGSKFGTEDREPRIAVRHFFHGAIERGNTDAWKTLPDFERRKTPLSDHLLPVMQGWSVEFMPLEPEFELAFERLEILASLFDFSGEDPDQIETALAEDPMRPAVWPVVGRSSWHSGNAKRLLTELSEDLAEPLLEAGFAKGSDRLLNLFVRNFKLINDRRRFG